MYQLVSHTKINKFMKTHNCGPYCERTVILHCKRTRRTSALNQKAKEAKDRHGHCEHHRPSNEVVEGGIKSKAIR